LNGLEIICLVSVFYLWLAAITETEEQMFQWSRFIVSNQAEACLLIGAIDLCEIWSGAVGKLWQ